VRDYALGHGLFGRVALRQREWDDADAQKEKHVKRASNKMSFNGGVGLFFHRRGTLGLVVERRL
jgi:hypothetical protein